MWPLKNPTSSSQWHLCSSENNDHWAVVVGLANEGHCIPSEEAEGSIRCKMNPHSLWFLLLYTFIWWFPSLSIRSVNMSNTSNGKFWANCLLSKILHRWVHCTLFYVDLTFRCQVTHTGIQFIGKKPYSNGWSFPESCLLLNMPHSLQACVAIPFQFLLLQRMLLWGFLRI